MNPDTMSVPERIALPCGYRTWRQTLCDTVYRRCGWTRDGAPTVARLQELGIDFPDVVEVVKAHGAKT